MQILREEEVKEKREAFLANEYIGVKEEYPTFVLDEHNEYATFIYVVTTEQALRRLERLGVEYLELM